MIYLIWEICETVVLARSTGAGVRVMLTSRQKDVRGVLSEGKVADIIVRK